MYECEAYVNVYKVNDVNIHIKLLEPTITFDAKKYSSQSRKLPKGTKSKTSTQSSLNLKKKNRTLPM